MAATAATRPKAEVAKVDFLVDENGARIELPDDSGVTNTGDTERQIGATGPAGWWRIGLVVLGIVALVLLLMQLVGGGGLPTTSVTPGTPSTPPAAEQPAPAV